MSVINETQRPTINNNSNNYHKASTINPADFNKKKCTWGCHNITKHCKINHVTILKPYFAYTDIPYMWLINKLKSTGDYGLANIIFLVVLIPFIVIYFIIRSLDIQREINKINNK